MTGMLPSTTSLTHGELLRNDANKCGKMPVLPLHHTKSRCIVLVSAAAVAVAQVLVQVVSEGTIPRAEDTLLKERRLLQGDPRYFLPSTEKFTLW